MNFIKLLRQSPWSARIGMLMVLINIVAALFAPVICPYSETEVVGDVWLMPNQDNWLGTDHLGRDLFTRLVYGARNTIAIAFVSWMEFAEGYPDEHRDACERDQAQQHQQDCMNPDREQPPRCRSKLLFQSISPPDLNRRHFEFNILEVFFPFTHD